MMRPLMVFLLVLALPRAAGAEWQFTPMIGETFLGRTSFVDLEAATSKHHANLGGAVALLGSGVFGAEGFFVWTPKFFQDGDQQIVQKSRTLALMGNVMLTAPRRFTEYTLRPFVSGGFGLMNTLSSDVAGLVPVHSTLAGFNIGGGAIGFLTARTGLRFDLRYYNNIGGSDTNPGSIGPERLRYMTASVGVVLRR